MTRCKFIPKLRIIAAMLAGICAVTTPATAETVRFSSVPFIGSTPTNVALEQGYFAHQGLDVVLTEHPGGWLALKDLFEGRADIAAVSDLPIVYSMFDKRKYTEEDRGDFVIFGDLIYLQDIQRVVARRDSGITAPGDLRGKKIGLMRGTTLDFYMDTFFAEYEIDETAIEIHDLNSFELQDAILSGALDAVFTWEPHVSNIRSELGDNALVMASGAGFTTAWLLVTSSDYAESHPEVLKGFLNATVRAERFIQTNPEDAMRIQAERSNTDPELVKKMFPLVNFDLSLSESLMITMEGQANWLVRKGVYSGEPIPDFLPIFYFEAIEAVKPKGVGIFR